MGEKQENERPHEIKTINRRGLLKFLQSPVESNSDSTLHFIANITTRERTFIGTIAVIMSTDELQHRALENFQTAPEKVISWFMKWKTKYKAESTKELPINQSQWSSNNKG